MDLALALGRTVAELEQAMSERELRQWFRYAGQKMLPMRRFEIMLAQIAQCVSRAAGADVNLSQFLLDPPAPKADTAETGAAALGQIAGGRRVVHIGKGKKRG